MVAVLSFAVEPVATIGPHCVETEPIKLCFTELCSLVVSQKHTQTRHSMQLSCSLSHKRCKEVVECRREDRGRGRRPDEQTCPRAAPQTAARRAQASVERRSQTRACRRGVFGGVEPEQRLDVTRNASPVRFVSGEKGGRVKVRICPEDLGCQILGESRSLQFALSAVCIGNEGQGVRLRRNKHLLGSNLRASLKAAVCAHCIRSD